MQHQERCWTFDEVLEHFEAIEKELQLDDSLIQGVPWWDIVRYPLFQEILHELKLLDKSEIITNKSPIKRKVISFLKILSDVIGLLSPKSPIWLKKNSIVIWGHPRRKFENGLYVDLYADPFVELLPKGADVAILERVEGDGHLEPVPTRRLFYVERLLSVGKIFSIIKKLTSNLKIDHDVVIQLGDRLSEVFSVKIDLEKRVLQSIVSWYGFYPLMRWFFKVKQPSHFFVVVSAGHEAIIAAAKSVGVVTYELQHGSPARGKLNYDYSSGMKKRSFPDWFLSFGEFWSRDLVLPLQEERIIPFGYPYLAKKASEYSNINKENLLLIISQPVHARALAEFAKEMAEYHKYSIKVEFKPHPAEFYYGEPDYFQKLRDSGVNVSDRNADLYSLFAKARWQVGVYSTALYEGLYFGVACYVLKVAGAEHMELLIEMNLARFIINAEEVDLDWVIRKEEARKIFAEPTVQKVEQLMGYSAKSYKD